MFPPIILSILFLAIGLVFVVTGLIVVISARKIKSDKVKHAKNSAMFINIIGGAISIFFGGYIFMTRQEGEFNPLVVFGSIVTLSLLMLISGSIIHAITPKDDSSESKLVKSTAKWGNIISGTIITIVITLIFLIKKSSSIRKTPSPM